MNRFMRSQIDTALLSLKTLYKSIEIAAETDDGVVSRQEKKEIKTIRKAVERFERKMQKIRK